MVGGTTATFILYWPYMFQLITIGKLAGCAVLGVGIWLNVDKDAQNSFEVAGVSFYVTGSVVFVAAGCVMLMVGFFGCYGAIKENTCMLGIYFLLLFAILVLEVGIGIWAIVSYSTLQEVIDRGLDEYNLNTTKADSKSSLVTLQKNLQCCGTTTGCADWNTNVNGVRSYGCACEPADFKNTSYCVLATSEGCQKDNSQTGTDQSNYIYAQPCNEAIYDLLYNNLTIVGAVGLAIGLAEIFGMILAVYLHSSITNPRV